jgi:hypothetical protein
LQLIGAPFSTTLLGDVTSAFTFDFANEWSKYIAYSLNYYSAGVWQQGFVVDDEHISFAVGNLSKQATDEAAHLEAKTSLTEAAAAYKAATITFEQLQENAIQQHSQVGLNPRGHRSCHDSVVTLKWSDGALHQILKSVNYDQWDTSIVGGLNSFVSVAYGGFQVLGQPANKAYYFEFGPDGDPVAPVPLDDGIIGCVGKSGIAMFAKIAPSPILVASDPSEPRMDSGIARAIISDGKCRNGPSIVPSPILVVIVRLS